MLPESVIPDRGPKFAAGLMKELNEILDIETKLYIAFYSQTDKQRARAVLKNRSTHNYKGIAICYKLWVEAKNGLWDQKEEEAC